MHRSQVIWRSTCKELSIKTFLTESSDAHLDTAAIPPGLFHIEEDISTSDPETGAGEPRRKRSKIARKANNIPVALDELKDKYLCLARVDIELVEPSKMGEKTLAELW